MWAKAYSNSVSADNAKRGVENKTRSRVVRRGSTHNKSFTQVLETVKRFNRRNLHKTGKRYKIAKRRTKKFSRGPVSHDYFFS